MEQDDDGEARPAARCPGCDEPLAPTARFCNFCGAPTPLFVPPPPNPRAARARRRRWRRTIGVVVFVAVAALVLGIAYAAVSGDRSRRDEATHTTLRTFATTTPPIPPAGPFAVTDGVNVRRGPATSYTSIATIELGKKVMVLCVTDGEMVTGARGQSNKWVRVTSGDVDGYVAALYVATGSAIDDRSVIPVCPKT